MKDPHKVWQTLKNFDDPNFLLICMAYCQRADYSMMEATLPEPTVLPPSRSDFACLET